ARHPLCLALAEEASAAIARAWVSQWIASASFDGGLLEAALGAGAHAMAPRDDEGRRIEPPRLPPPPVVNDQDPSFHQQGQDLPVQIPRFDQRQAQPQGTLDPIGVPVAALLGLNVVEAALRRVREEQGTSGARSEGRKERLARLAQVVPVAAPFDVSP